MAWRSTEEVLEVLATGAGGLRSSESVIEVLAHNPAADPYGEPSWRSSQMVLEVLATGAGGLRSSESVVEALTHNPDADPYGADPVALLGSTHPHTSDQLTLLGAVGLQGSLHPHTSDQLALVPLTVLNDSFHPHSSEELVVLSAVGLEDSFHPQNSGLLNISEALDSFPVVARIRPNPVKPAGIDGQVLFRNLYLAITPDTGGRATITPVLDGEELTDEAVTIEFTSDNRRQEYEIALTRHYTVAGEERVRYGLRGTEFTFELEVEDTHGSGDFISIDGCEVEVQVVREMHPDSPFGERDLELVDLTQPRPFFFGAGGGRLARYAQGRDDLGSAIEGFAQPNFIAPEGVSAEYVFTDLYLYFDRWNPTDLTLSLTPLVDGETLTEQQFTVEGVDRPKRHVVEISLPEPHSSDGSEQFRYAPRGTWFSFQLKTVGSLPDGDVILAGANLEYEVVRESLGAS